MTCTHLVRTTSLVFPRLHVICRQLEWTHHKAEVGNKMDVSVQSMERTLTVRFETAPKS